MIIFIFLLLSNFPFDFSFDPFVIKNMLFSSQILIDSLDIFVLLMFNLIPLWSVNIFCMTQIIETCFVSPEYVLFSGLFNKHLKRMYIPLLFGEVLSKYQLSQVD